MTDITPPNLTDDVYKFIITGQGNSDILEFLESTNMPLADAKQLFEDSLKRFVKAANMPRSVRRGWCFEAYRDLYRGLLESGDYNAALKAVGEIAKLANLFPSKGEKDTPETDTLKDEIDNYIDTVMALK